MEETNHKEEFEGLTTVSDLKVTVSELKVTVGELKVTVSELLTTIQAIDVRTNILQARQYNSSISRDNKLHIVPTSQGSVPNTAYPKNLLELLVAENEKLPNGEKNTWTKEKSRKLLMEYGEEGEDRERARNSNIKVARMLGITQTQLIWAQLALKAHK
jgi:hypothetical protein